MVCSLLGAASPRTADAQAWVQPPDGYYVKLSGSYLSTRDEFDFQGSRHRIFANDPTRSDGSFRDVTFTTYAEYGLRPRLTVVGTLPFKILTSGQTVAGTPGFPSVRSEPTNGGFADLTVSVRTPIVRRPFALAFQGGIKLPLGYEKTADNGGPVLGTGEIDAEARLAWGLSFYPIPAYVSASGGYRVRGGPLHDEVFYDAEAGYTLGPVFLKIRFDGLQNAGVDPSSLAVAADGQTVSDIVVGDQDIWKLNPAVAYALSEGLALNAELFHTLAGKGTVAGTAVSLGLVLTR